MLADVTAQLKERQDLTVDQINAVVEELVSGDVEPAPKAAFLSALAQKGETIEEIAAFAKNLREKSLQPDLSDACRQGEILDVCGTGGDHQNTFNISTTVALVAAAAGVTVAKHGNRAITSKSGSADVLEALGIRIDFTPEETAASLESKGFAFFFAQKFHPAFKNIGPARKLCAEQGQRTIFNFLGPLLNPARPTCQLIGVPKPELCEPIAKVLQSLGIRRGMVVCGSVGSGHLDELSTLDTNQVAEFYQDRGFSVETLDPSGFPLQPVTLADLAGGDSEHNAQIIRDLLQGKEKGPKRDAVLLNAGAALFVAEKADSLTAGWDLAAQLIDDGTAAAKLQSLAQA